MMARRVNETYLALVTPAPRSREWTIEVPLRRDEQGREAYMRVCPPDHADAEPPSPATALWARWTARRCWSCRRAPAGCISCASIWPRSAARSSATPATAAR